MQQCLGGCRQGPAASDDVFFGRVFSDIMADTTDTWNKQHAGREALGENLGVVAGTAGHADPPAGGMGLSSRSQALLYSLVHAGGFAPGGYAHQVDVDRTLFVGFFYDSSCFRLEGIEDFVVRIAELQEHFSPARNDAR